MKASSNVGASVPLVRKPPARRRGTSEDARAYIMAVIIDFPESESWKPQ